ncbi:MAG: D-aminoacyl-tRNA deacylase [Planctomycetota bacterium]
MRILLQRVSHARVVVDDRDIGSIDLGCLLLLGITHDDSHQDADRLARKVANLRIFPNDAGKFDRSLIDVGGGALVVSQFTLFADTSQGNRPSFLGAARPEQASPLCDYFVQALRKQGIGRVETGQFAADMKVTLCNDGPVTLWLDTDEF